MCTISYPSLNLFIGIVFLEPVPMYLPLCVSQMKWHEICLSTPAAILEVLNAWENGVLSVEAVQVSPVLCVVYFVLL
jgi:uncharacterized membrane protein